MLVQFGLGFGPVLLDATKGFTDLAERYVTSNDGTKVEVLERLGCSD